RGVCTFECSFGIAEQPQEHRTKGQARHPEVLAKSRHQSPVLGDAVKGECFVVVHFGSNEVSHKCESTPHGAVSNHQRHHAALLPAKGQKPGCELSRNVTIEAYEIEDPLAKEG